MAEQQTEKKTSKPDEKIKPAEKFIWLGISVVIATFGSICHTNGIVFPLWGIILYSAMLMFTAIIAAQKASIHRFAFAGETGDKLKYFLLSLLYYVIVIIAVIYVFQALWVSGVFAI